jgi:hypothetical protein
MNAVRQMSRDEVAARLEQSRLRDPDAEKQAIRRAYGPPVEEIVQQQAPFLDMSPERYAALKQRILDGWDEVQRIAQVVPSPGELAAGLQKVGAPVDARELGLGEEEIRLGAEYGHYVRYRFTMGQLRHILVTP